ncbi:hypothetical protein HY492_04275 [Candidatus Woesearchaeota archaeon]|nr:hypothetical protein [Candidatus Woesearchaeota archaeon]
MPETDVPDKKGFGANLFSAPRAPIEPDTSVQQDIAVLSTRLRVAEERYADLRRKLQLIEQNMLMHQKKAVLEAKNVSADVMEIKRTVRAMEDKVIMAIKELQLTARKEDVDVLKRYVELWDPIRFVSYDQAEKLIDEKLGKHTDELHEE